MTTRLRHVRTHPTLPLTVLIGALTGIAQVASPAPTRRNGGGRYAAPRLSADAISAPPQVADLGRLLAASGALEVYYLRGASDIITRTHNLALDPGCYLVARFPKDHEPMDGAVGKFTREAEDRWEDEP